MLKNIFNCSGIAKKTHILRVEQDVIYYSSSSNIIKYENDKITPIIRNGQEIIGLEVRDGIILCDLQFNVEMNNEFVYCSKSAVTAVSKTKRICTENGNILDFFIFSTLSNIFIVSEKEIFSIECKNIVTIDCKIKKENLLVLLGSLEGNLIRITIDYENMMIANKNVFSTCQKLNDHALINYCTLFEEERILKKIENVTKLQKYRLNTFRIHDDTITGIKITDKFIITSSQDNTIKLFNPSTFEQIDTLLGHADIVYECYYDRRNDRIISAGGDNCVIVWKNANNGWKIETKIGKLANLPFFSAVQIKQEKKFIIYVQGYNGGIYKYIDFNLVKSTSGHCDKINSLDIRNDLILTGSSDFSSRLYKNMAEIARPCLHGHSIKNAIFAGDMIVVGSEETIIRIFEETTVIKHLGNKLIDKEEKLNIATPSELSLTNEIRKVEEIEVNEHNLQNILCFKEKKKIYAQFFANSALAANSEIIVCSNKSANLKFSGIFLIRNYKAVQYIAVHDLGIEKIEISLDGKYVVAVSRDKCVSVYSVDDKFEEIDQSLKYQNKKLEESDKYIKFIRKEQIHQRTINTVCFHTDNEIFITASKDRTINFINLHSLEKIKTIKLEKEPTALRYHNNILIVGFIDGAVSIFSSKYEKIFYRKIHGQKINEIKCIQNNVLTIGDDWLLRVFELEY